MFELLQKFIVNWLKSLFHGNPIVEQPGEYLGEVANAMKVGFISIFVLIGMALLGSVVFVLGVINKWF